MFAFLATSGCDGGRHLPDQVGDAEVLGQELHLAGLDLREVEDVVDDRQQVLAGPVDLLQVGRRVLGDLLGGQLLEQLAVADDGVQGRAQLVAHVGQERALDLAGLDRLLVGHDEVGVDPAQLLLDPLALADLPAASTSLALASSAVRSRTRSSSSSWALQQGLLGLLARRDIEGDALEVEGIALLVAHHLGLAVDPDHAAVAGQEAILGAEMLAQGAGLRELGMPADRGRPGGAAGTRGSGLPAIPFARSPAATRSAG